jgi:Ca2+:H+ antiporter
VLGMSILCGGIIYSTQTFDKAVARSNFSLLFFAAISLIVPLAFKLTHVGSTQLDHALIVISFTIALILLIIYLTGLIFSLVQQRNLFLGHDHNNDNGNGKQSKWSLNFAISVLAITIFFVALESELLITKVKSVITDLNLPEIFIGIIIIPILGNVAEHASAILMATRNKVDISLEIAIGSSVQIAMLVTPILILYSFTLANPLIYVYDPFVVVAVITAIFLSLYVVQDGKTFWLEGALLVFSYIIFCVMFFYDD